MDRSLAIAGLLGSLLVSSQAAAQDANIDARIENTRVAIHQRLENGTMTRGQSHRLAHELRRLKAEEARMSAVSGGALTNDQLHYLGVKLDALDGQIQRNVFER